MATPGPEPLELPAGVHQLCGCGRSRQGWFCDGAHLGTGRVSYELRLSEAATMLLCRCGRSHRYPSATAAIPPSPAGPGGGHGDERLDRAGRR
ncbi:CDGSH iron-sulfur domain-containing protein [Synechococcus sp. CBW1006]|uniref:CDGSH iron-sulfur domain-containing protein n=1 Tax=Synechococcus sp. CBW1006 TaxID=1353138 RepID=UPI0018CCD940|nr:CDGSH iron-sulfur domain-containing protein [Synechococcus sp. CBW1006]QPN66274.1 CDGSH iron-sulfur domain-containing protein [Synechococcus sp. CBW1006]